MVSFVDFIKQVVTLTDSVEELKNGLKRLSNKVDDHEKRIIRLEIREELLQEKMANTAIKAVNEMNYKIFERLLAVENTVKSLPQSPPLDS